MKGMQLMKRSAPHALMGVLLMLGLGACSSTVVKAPAGSAAAPRPVSVPKPGVSVTVQRGDTLYSIASRNGILAPDLAAWNGIASPYTIFPGQRLRLYPGSGGTTATAPPPQSGKTTPVTPPSTGVTPVTVPASSGFSWRWPTNGQVIGGFVVGEPTKQGVDIAGTSGQPVVAAADGEVIYSGAGLVGYGEVIVVRHNKLWLSTYAHNRKRLVNEGQLVKAGEQIAEMGRSGTSRDMLHFEIRYNANAVDPLLYLPRK